MGRRGKQRAKQAKAAREIKYHTMDTDFGQLERELGGRSDDLHRGSAESPRTDARDERDAS